MKKFTFRPVAFVMAPTDHGSILLNRHDYRLAADSGYGVGYGNWKNSTQKQNKTRLHQ